MNSSFIYRSILSSSSSKKNLLNFLEIVQNRRGAKAARCFSIASHLFNSKKLHSAKMSAKATVVFVLGAPGAGKGTQCSRIVETFGFEHLSAGDLLREERQRPGSEFGELIESKIVNGLIVPVEVTCSLLENAMNKCSKEKGINKFLIDGFPRNENNVQGWTKQMSDKADVKFVLFFDCTEGVCIERCLSRGAAGSGRSDDNLESLKKRFATFYSDSLPIVESFEAKDMVRKIDGNQDPDKVFEAVRAVFTAAFD